MSAFEPKSVGRRLHSITRSARNTGDGCCDRVPGVVSMIERDRNLSRRPMKRRCLGAIWLQFPNSFRPPWTPFRQLERPVWASSSVGWCASSSDDSTNSIHKSWDRLSQSWREAPSSDSSRPTLRYGGSTQLDSFSGSFSTPP